MKPECKHPPKRLYSWYAVDEYGNKILCIGCCECGKVLKGGTTGKES